MSKYFKQGSTVEYVEEYAEIQALKFENARHSVLGFMLGDYDENGSYVISPQIVKELIAMPKYIVEAVDNYEICKSLVKLDKQLTFLITYEGERVTLSLMESVNFEGNSKLNIGSWSNVSEYELDYVLVSGEVNRTAIYSKWNVSEYGGSVLDIMNCEEELLEKYFGIVNRFKFLISQNIQLLEKEEELEIAEEEYFLNIFSILEDYPELKKLVVKEIKENLEDKKEIIKVDKPFFTKALNEVLNKAIENNISSVKEEKQEELKKLQHNAKVRLNIQRQEVVQCVTEKVSNLENTPKVENKKEIKEEKKEVVIFETDNSFKKSTVADLARKFVEKRKVAEERSQENAVAAILKTDNINKQPESSVETKEKKVENNSTRRVVSLIAQTVKYPIVTNASPETRAKVENAKKQEVERRAQQQENTNSSSSSSFAKTTQASNTGKNSQSNTTSPKKTAVVVGKVAAGGKADKTSEKKSSTDANTTGNKTEEKTGLIGQVARYNNVQPGRTGNARVSAAGANTPQQNGGQQFGPSGPGTDTPGGQQGGQESSRERQGDKDQINPDGARVEIRTLGDNDLAEFEKEVLNNNSHEKGVKMIDPETGRAEAVEKEILERNSDNFNWAQVEEGGTASKDSTEEFEEGFSAGT